MIDWLFKVFVYIVQVLLFLFIACVANDIEKLERKVDRLSDRQECLVMVLGTRNKMNCQENGHFKK